MIVNLCCENLTGRKRFLSQKDDLGVFRHFRKAPCLNIDLAKQIGKCTIFPNILPVSLLELNNVDQKGVLCRVLAIGALIL